MFYVWGIGASLMRGVRRHVLPSLQLNDSARILGAAVIALMSGALEAGTPALDQAMSAWAAPNQRPNYRYAFSDLNGDGLPDAIVLISDPRYCGSGGCTMVVLKGTTSGFEVVSHSTITREPIFVLAAANSGWHTLSVLVSGGGVLQSRQALLRFNGEQYPPNPSVEGRATRADLKSAEQLNLE